MTYTLDQLIQIDPAVFGTMKKQELEEIKEQLMQAKKQKTKELIKPVEKEHIKPVHDRHIKPLKDEHIKPIDKVLKDLKTYLPKPKPKKAYLTINGQRYGPLTKKEFMELITEVEGDEEEEQE